MTQEVRICPVIRLKYAESIQLVSYTHLDVYKRQAFPQPRSSHIALDSSLPLKGYCYYLALTLKRVLIFFYT